MRYAKITQHYPAHHHQPLMNVGDIVQTLAIEQLYERMGVASEQVAGISKYSLNAYRGETLVVPVTGFFNERPDMGEIPFSPDIRPVFLGYHLGWGLYDANNLEFFKRHQPIGCRDTHTLRHFREHGVDAYICGCPTILFARRDPQPERRKVFMIDTPAELDAFLPDALRQHAERLSHIVPVRELPLSNEEYAELVAHTRSLLQRYRDEARLVITGRIHCAVPCLAMGIPVIFTVGDMRDSYDFLSNLTPIYTRDRFQHIDWNPAPAELESLKADFFELARDALQHAFSLASRGQRLHDFYYAAQPAGHYRHELDKLQALFAGATAEAQYIIWGVGALGSKVYQLMQCHFPQLRLQVCCDSYAEKDFFGQPVIRPQQLPPPGQNVYVLAATSYGVNESEQWLEQLGYRKGYDYASMLVLPGMSSARS